MMKYYFGYKFEGQYFSEVSEYNSKKEVESDIHSNGCTVSYIVSEKELVEKYDGNLDYAIECILTKKEERNAKQARLNKINRDCKKRLEALGIYNY